MNWGTEIPCAKSEPVNTEDRVLATLLWRAAQLGELLDNGDALPRGATRFQALLEEMLALIESDPELARLLDDLPEVIGSGAVLPAIFQKIANPPKRPIAVPTRARDTGSPVSRNERPLLSKRETEILQAVAHGRSRKQIAGALGITEMAVRAALYNAYKKLDVESMVEAITKSAGLGLISSDFYDFWLSIRQNLDLEFRSFDYFFLAAIEDWPEELFPGPIRRLTALAAALLLMGSFPALIRRYHEPPEGLLPSRNFVLEYTSEGYPVGSMELHGSRGLARSLACAPAGAARHGFAEGHLYIGLIFAGANPLNPAAIAEFTPKGEFVRAFTGGASARMNLRNCIGLEFLPDGRLLAASADAILEFTEGGGAVRPFAQMVPYGTPSVDAMGRVYAMGGWEHHKPIRIFGSDGSAVRTVDPAEEHQYIAVAPGRNGSLYAGEFLSRSICVIDRDGCVTASFGQGKVGYPTRLLPGRHGHLYALYMTTDAPMRSYQLRVFDGQTFLYAIKEPNGVVFTHFTFGPNGNLLLSAIQYDA